MKNFDERSYLNDNPDVAAAVQRGEFKDGMEHFLKFGRKEGRTLVNHDHLTREEKILYELNKSGIGLEIGPSHRPVAPKRLNYRVDIVDYLDKNGLKNKYANQIEYGVNIDNIEDVDYVWRGEPLSELIGKTKYYDWIIASHVIEHIPDPITFLQQCELLLKPEGRLSLAIPDKRYCFDYFNNPSSTGQLLDAFFAKRKRPSPGQIFDHFANACKMAGKIAWDETWKKNNCGNFELIHTIEQARTLWEISTNGAEYIDSHCWRFTPESFTLLLGDFNLLSLINLIIVRQYATTGHEFFVTLAISQEPPGQINRTKNLIKACQ